MHVRQSHVGDLGRPIELYVTLWVGARAYALYISGTAARH